MSSLFSEMPYKQVIMGCFRKQAAHHLMALPVGRLKQSYEMIKLCTLFGYAI